MTSYDWALQSIGVKSMSHELDIIFVITQNNQQSGPEHNANVSKADIFKITGVFAVMMWIHEIDKMLPMKRFRALAILEHLHVLCLYMH